MTFTATRRSTLAAVALAGYAGRANAAVSATLYITPQGGGDGRSWERAARLDQLDDVIRAARPGGEVRIAADRGPYVLEDVVELHTGGRAGSPVSVRGVDSRSGAPSAALIRSNRGNRGGDEVGIEAFRLARGANHLHFSHFAFEAIGNGCFRVGAPVTNLVIEDCSFQNIYRFLENTATDGEGSARLRDFVVRRCRGAQVERGFLRIRYDSRDGLIEDCAAQGMPNEGGYIPAGCALDGRASAITYRRVVMENFQQWRAGDYWNGDGFSDEGYNRTIRYEACEARGSTDGGFDCKSRDVVLENCVAEDNKRNFRIWSARGRMTGCISRNPNFRGAGQERASACHVWIGGDEGARIEIANLSIADRDSPAIMEIDNDGVRAEIRGITIESPRENWGETALHRQDGVITAYQD
jgi:hypothetical protein